MAMTNRQRDSLPATIKQWQALEAKELDRSDRFVRPERVRFYKAMSAHLKDLFDGEIEFSASSLSPTGNKAPKADPSKWNLTNEGTFME